MDPPSWPEPTFPNGGTGFCHNDMSSNPMYGQHGYQGTDPSFNHSHCCTGLPIHRSTWVENSSIFYPVENESNNNIRQWNYAGEQFQSSVSVQQSSPFSNMLPPIETRTEQEQHISQQNSEIAGSSQMENSQKPRLHPYQKTSSGKPHRTRKRVESHSATVSSSSSTDVQKTLGFYDYNQDQWTPVFDENGGRIDHFDMIIFNVQTVEWGKEEQSHIVYRKTLFSFEAKFAIIAVPKFIWTNNAWKNIKEFKIEYLAEGDYNSVIEIEKLNTKRRTIGHKSPAISPDELGKKTFRETHLRFKKSTRNNKKLPNPRQKYYLFVVKLVAVTEENQEFLVRAVCSDRLIVRGGNPQQFREMKKFEGTEYSDSDEEEEDEGRNPIVMDGPVVIGREKPHGNAALTIGGNLFVTGKYLMPSDERLKIIEGIYSLETALENVKQLVPIVFEYKEDFARENRMEDRERVGFSAQQVEKVLKDAVEDVNGILSVDERRIFMEGLGATIAIALRMEDLQKTLDVMQEGIEDKNQQIENLGKFKEDVLPKIKRLEKLFKSHLSLYSISMSSGLNRLGHQKENSIGSPAVSNRFSNITMWTSLIMIVLMIIIAGGLWFYNYLYYLDVSDRIGGPNAQWPLNRPRPPPENLVLPVERLRLLQRNISALSPSCPDDFCHSYCCEGTPPVSNNLTKYVAPPPLKPLAIPFSTSSLISLPHLNTTIDERFCVENSCQRKRGKYRLYVPLSPFLPSSSLFLHFNLPKGKIIDGCGHAAEFQHHSCDNSVADIRKHKTLRQIDDVTFEVPVGRLLQSAFRFRIGYTTGLCHLSTYSPGFDEIILHFYRQCI